MFVLYVTVLLPVGVIKYDDDDDDDDGDWLSPMICFAVIAWVWLD